MFKISKCDILKWWRDLVWGSTLNASNTLICSLKIMNNVHRNEDLERGLDPLREAIKQWKVDMMISLASNRLHGSRSGTNVSHGGAPSNARANPPLGWTCVRSKIDAPWHDYFGPGIFCFIELQSNQQARTSGSSPFFFACWEACRAASLLAERFGASEGP